MTYVGPILSTRRRAWSRPNIEGPALVAERRQRAEEVRVAESVEDRHDPPPFFASR